jgi:hypothetical protein
MAPMMLQRLSPLMEIFVIAGGKGLVNGFAAAAIDSPWYWAEIVGIDSSWLR